MTATQQTEPVKIWVLQRIDELLAEFDELNEQLDRIKLVMGVTADA